MKFTLSWLKRHLRTTADAAAIADALTRIGLEVEDVADAGAALAGFRIARVLTAERHPQADKLQLLQVDRGDGAPVQVVCGAPNARAGLVGVLGEPGARVPASGLVLKVSAIRGVTSNGMMCSARELGTAEDGEGIVELPADAPVGAAYAGWAGLDDPVFDIAVTPNRQDCMGVRGIARDLAAAGLGQLLPLAIPTLKPAGPSPIAVETRDPAGCPALFGQVVQGVRNGEAPGWMQRLLRAVGQRPISALVDITNFVMLDLGRPLHVYDLARLSGPLVARVAEPGDEVEALNGRRYRLDPPATVIADDAGVQDIGGIMGGLHSAVGPDTTDVLVECAYFTPEAIARTGQALGLGSDARQRFERGVDPAFLADGLAIATGLVVELCGGRPSAAVHAGTPPTEPRFLRYDPQATVRIAGVTVAPERQRAILHDLGFLVDGAWTVRVPSWRRDVDGIADLVEEVVRIEGLDRVASVPLPRPPGVASPTATPAQRVERLVRRTAAARGLTEAVTWSFLPEAQARRFAEPAWVLANPLSEELKAMRPSLLPGLLAAAARNLARGAGEVRLFEIGRRYLADGEPLTLGLVLAGAPPRDWHGAPGHHDAFAAKAEALALLRAAGAPADRLQVGPPLSDAWHPGRGGTLRLGKVALAAFGALHPDLLRAFDLPAGVVAAELFLHAVPPVRGGGRARAAYRPVALQAVRRDFAFLAPADLPADALLRAVRGADKAAIVDATVFDLFTGEGVPAGEKSIAVEAVLQPSERSFTEAELQAISDRIVAAASALGGRLRG